MGCCHSHQTQDYDAACRHRLHYSIQSPACLSNETAITANVDHSKDGCRRRSRRDGSFDGIAGSAGTNINNTTNTIAATTTTTTAATVSGTTHNGYTPQTVNPLHQRSQQQQQEQRQQQRQKRVRQPVQPPQRPPQSPQPDFLGYYPHQYRPLDEQPAIRDLRAKTPCNRPLKPYTWRRRDRKQRTWTRRGIERERREFFETRVTGRSEIWLALRLAAEELRAGNLGSAQGIVDAAGITSPHGDLVEGCYDQYGVSYRLAPVIVADPPSSVMVAEEEEEDRGGDGSSSGTEKSISKGIEAGARSSSKEDTASLQMPRITVKVRLSDGERDMRVQIGRDQHVRALEKRIRAEAGIPRDTRIRMVHLGKLLNPHKTLSEQGWILKNVITVYIQGPQR